MAMGGEQIHLDGSSCPHILRASLNQPALSSSAQTRPGQHFLLSLQIDSQCGQKDARIAFFPLADVEMDAIQIYHMPMPRPSTSSPSPKGEGEVGILQLA